MRIEPRAPPADLWLVAMRICGFVMILGVLAASGYAMLDKARAGKLDPIDQVAAARGELASAQYVLAIVAGQLHQVHALDAT